MVFASQLRAAGGLPRSLRSVRPTAGRPREAAGEPHRHPGARARRGIHRGLVHKRLDALRGESRRGGVSRVNAVPALKVEKLKKTYSNGLLALDGVSLDVEVGRFFGLLGPNGAGKTTLINSVVSLARPDSGTVEVFGRDAYREVKEARGMIGVSPQEINLDKFLTVEETMLYHAGYYGVPKEKAKERTEELLERFALSHKRRDRVNTLSGGMKRRDSVPPPPHVHPEPPLLLVQA